MIERFITYNEKGELDYMYYHNSARDIICECLPKRTAHSVSSYYTGTMDDLYNEMSGWWNNIVTDSKEIDKILMGLELLR